MFSQSTVRLFGLHFTALAMSENVQSEESLFRRTLGCGSAHLDDARTYVRNGRVWKLRPFFKSRTVDENRRVILQSRHQDRFSVRVWTDILGDWLIELYDFPSRLIGNMYNIFFVHIVPDLVENELEYDHRCCS